MPFKKTALFSERLFHISKTAIKILFKSELTKPQRLKLFFEESGGAFVKLGQILALRRDFLPTEYTLELLKLLNNMPVVPFSKIHKIFIGDIGEPVEKFFTSFDIEPIGSASVAQVYKAVLKTGEEVAVKILRPGTEKIFEVDFLIISFFASVIDLLNLTSSLSIKEVAADFIRWTRRELDFRYESNNAVAFLKYSKGVQGTIIPRQYQEHTSSRVLIQELISGGVSVLNIISSEQSREQLIDKKINPDYLALYLIKDAMRQYFIDGFFHADAHPANLAFLPGDENCPEGKIAYFDFGIVGEAEKESRLTLLKFVHAISTKDIEAIAKYLLQYGRKNFKKEILYYFKVEPEKKKIADDIIGIIEKDIISHFKTEVQEIMESWFVDEKDSHADLKKRSSALVFINLVRKAEKYGVHFPLDIILFFRGLVIIDMVALQISPQFDIIKAMESFFENNPIDEVERKVRDQTNWNEIDEKIISLNDDWESSRERLIMQKEKVAIMRERMLEIVFYYAERHSKIKDLFKQL